MHMEAKRNLSFNFFSRGRKRKYSEEWSYVLNQSFHVFFGYFSSKKLYFKSKDGGSSQ